MSTEILLVCLSLSNLLPKTKYVTNCTGTKCKEKKTKVLLVAFFFCSEKWVINTIFDNRERVVPHFFLRDSRASETRARVKITPREKRWHAAGREKNEGRHVSPFLAWDDFHARSRFARSTIPEEKWGTTRSLIWQINVLGWQSS